MRHEVELKFSEVGDRVIAVRKLSRDNTVSNGGSIIVSQGPESHLVCRISSLVFLVHIYYACYFGS